MPRKGAGSWFVRGKGRTEAFSLRTLHLRSVSARCRVNERRADPAAHNEGCAGSEDRLGVRCYPLLCKSKSGGPGSAPGGKDRLEGRQQSGAAPRPSPSPAAVPSRPAGHPESKEGSPRFLNSAKITVVVAPRGTACAGGARGVRAVPGGCRPGGLAPHPPKRRAGWRAPCVRLCAHPGERRS